MGTWLMAVIACGCMQAALFGAEKLTLVNGYVFVNATINGRGPFRMLIDTGDSSTSINPQVGRVAGLVFSHSVTLATMSGESQVPAASAVRIRVGDFETEVPEVLGTKQDVLQQLDPKAAGVLGQGFLSQFPYLIDYRQKVMWLGEEAVAEAERLGAPMVAERVAGMLLLTVKVGRNAELLQLALDSGAPHLLMQCGTRCSAFDGSREGNLQTNTGRRTVQKGRLGRVTFGDVVFSNVEAVLVNDRPLVARQDGVVPANWFSAVYVNSGKNVVRVAR